MDVYRFNVTVCPFHAYVTERFYQAVKTHVLETFIFVVRILKSYPFSDSEMHSHGHRNHAKSNTPGTEQQMPCDFMTIRQTSKNWPLVELKRKGRG